MLLLLLFGLVMTITAICFTISRTTASSVFRRKRRAIIFYVILLLVCVVTALANAFWHYSYFHSYLNLLGERNVEEVTIYDYYGLFGVVFEWLEKTVCIFESNISIINHIKIEDTFGWGVDYYKNYEGFIILAFIVKALVTLGWTIFFHKFFNLGDEDWANDMAAMSRNATKEKKYEYYLRETSDGTYKFGKSDVTKYESADSSTAMPILRYIMFLAAFGVFPIFIAAIMTVYFILFLITKGFGKY